MPIDAHIGKTASDFKASSSESWENVAQEVIRTGETHRIVVSSDVNNLLKVYDVIIIPEKDERENVCSVISIARDISIIKETERILQKQAASLEESEKRFRDLVKDAPTAIYEIDFLNQKFATVNDATCSLSGYSREELLSMNIFDLLDEESKSKFIARITEFREGKLPEAHVEYKVIRKDGAYITVVLDMKFKVDDHGKTYGAIVVGHDVTERKKTLEALSRSELKLKYHLENSPLGVIEWDKDFNVLQWSEEAEKMFGHRKLDVLGMNISTLRLVYDEDKPKTEKIM